MNHTPSSLRRSAAVLAATTAAMALPALADDTPWWAHVGPARVQFHDSSVLNAAGTVVPGAGAKSSDNTAAVIELGYRFTPSWSGSLTFGAPPTSRIRGTGSAEPLGLLGEVTYGPLVFAAQYRFDGLGPVKPYLGAGPVYYLILRSRDGAIQQLDVKNGWGSALQAGAEWTLTPQWGLFVDVKKVYVKTTATGVLPAAGGAPVQARTTLNPLLVHTGLVMRF